FVGHIGGDDFIVILDKVQSNEYFDDIEMQFSEGILNFYNDDDIRNGYILIQNRRGMIEKFPLMTITCVVLNNLSQKYEDVYHLTENLSDLKREAKQYKIPS
ncbi:MAG TPA: diguanylate cyclase, partial [Proteiniclasticum sp.]|nr:diguanylate cyclase [Proteiniclasticum sp.]